MNEGLIKGDIVPVPLSYSDLVNDKLRPWLAQARSPPSSQAFAPPGTQSPHPNPGTPKPSASSDQAKG